MHIVDKIKIMKSEKRVLKPLSQRKPKESLSYPELVDAVSKETKFRKPEVKLLMDTMLSIVHKNLVKKKSVRLPELGTLFPTIKRSRVGMALNGGVGKPVRMVVPDCWKARFQTSRDLEQDLSKLSVSEEELEELFKK